ncbi:MAG TPA: hypothetical protein VGH91_05515 [Gammaproteobacteria bacterium]|jgi:hypothetical protein
MAKIQTHTPAAAAQSLLDLLVEMHIRPGDAIDWSRVDLMWGAGGASSPADLKIAKDFAAANGMLEVRNGQPVLTEQGAKSGGGLPASAARWAEDIVEMLAAFFHERGGDSFTVDELRQRWQMNREHRPDDLAVGLQYGVQQGWFTKMDDGNYTLTTKGRAQV